MDQNKAVGTVDKTHVGAVGAVVGTSLAEVRRDRGRVLFFLISFFCAVSEFSIDVMINCSRT